jgi:hypothetical protein
MPLRIGFFTALLPDLCANDGFIPMTTYGTDAIPFRPQFATPQTLFDCRDAVQDLAGREAFDDLDHLGWALVRHRLHQKMDMIFLRANLQKGYVIPLGDVSADVSEYGVDFWIKDDPAILRRTHDMVKQGRDVVPFMPIGAHASDHTTTAKAEASFEESDPRD